MSLSLFIGWFVRLFTPTLMAGVREIVRAVAHDLGQAHCSLYTRQDADGALRYAHNLVGAVIYFKACRRAGIRPPIIRVQGYFRVTRVRSRAMLMRRLDELMRRIERVDALAWRLARKLARWPEAAPAPIPARMPIRCARGFPRTLSIRARDGPAPA
jgi:hypothetical protein